MYFLNGSRSRALLALWLLGAIGIGNVLPAYSGIYKVKCDDVAAKKYAKDNTGPRVGPMRPGESSAKKCKMQITITADEISSPSTIIPTTRVTSWGGGGDSSTSVGTGVATTLLFGPIGLLGFLAKNHVYSFTINGFDTEGNRESIVLDFKDKVQPAKLMMELPIVTGLALGQSRSEAEIKELEETGGNIEPASIGKYEEETLYGGPAEQNEEETLYGGPAEQNSDKFECGRVIKDYDCSYNKYLEANPSMQEWAEANPEMAHKERIRLKSID